ncbi:GyrI-like domain-containing protein [Devosia sp.]|uniref:GyrI-like domain-containing protein n=1 Tax=Devosia sp. TaxID=1871048 RepID=UPI001AC73A90|nr:GyrI-like domain-containing protein [Devosia sp.]MBN9311234.1 GyrI-like domain-containing protein [Devosia sp.]
MLTGPRVVERKAQPYVAVRRAVTIPFGDVIPAAMEALFAAVNAQQLQPSGPVFFKYNFINMPDLEIDFGVPLAASVPAPDGLVAGIVPAGRYVEATHLGHYDKLMDATAAVIDWARSRGIRWDAIETPEGDSFVARLETYPNGPDDEPDPDRWETIIAIKIRD